MKAIEKTASYLWQKIAHGMPNEKQCEAIAEKIPPMTSKQQDKIVLCNPVPFAGIVAGLETRIAKYAQPYYQLSIHEAKGTVTHSATCIADIQANWFETFYEIKNNFEPLRE